MINDPSTILLCLAVVGQSLYVWDLRLRLGKLEKNSHPPVDITPAVVGALQALRVICDRPPAGYFCSRPVGHHGPCATHEL